MLEIICKHMKTYLSYDPSATRWGVQYLTTKHSENIVKTPGLSLAMVLFLFSLAQGIRFTQERIHKPLTACPGSGHTCFIKNLAQLSPVAKVRLTRSVLASPSGSSMGGVLSRLINTKLFPIILICIFYFFIGGGCEGGDFLKDRLLRAGHLSRLMGFRRGEGTLDFRAWRSLGMQELLYCCCTGLVTQV